MAERAYVRIQRARAEERLQVSEEFSRTVLESSPDCVKVISPSGELLVLNGPGLCLLDIDDAASVLGKAWSDLWPVEAQPLIHAALEKAGRGESAQFEAFCPTAKGTPKYWDVSAAPVRNAAGAVESIVAVSRDVTERSRTEAALREAKEAAESANASKDRFLAVLSHELRTPLTPVLMTLAALEHDPALPAELREDLAMMKRNVELEVKLIDDLLDLSRITSGKLELKIEAVDLNAAVRHVCGSCRPQLLEQNVRLEMELSAEACTAGADAARLQQVIWNVLRNAIKFTPANGTIRVSTARLTGERCEVRVQDSGIGIPAEILPLIFDAFEQGDQRITRQFGGLGLGLAISKALIEKHAGTIRAESEGTGKGATFILELPGKITAPADATPHAPAQADATATRVRLLIVEDHADTGRALERHLTRAGFHITLAHDVASALAAAERGTFDVIVSDLGLPDGSGVQLMEQLRQRSEVPGIAMSGYGMEEDIRRSLAAGFTEHLVKPVAIPQLIEAIQRVAAIIM